MKSKKTVEELIDSLHDADREVRWISAMALGTLGGFQAMDALFKALKDETEDHAIRWGACSALGHIGEPAVGVLLLALNDEDQFMRECAAEALGEIGNVDVLSFVLESIRDEVREVRWEIITALGQIGDPQSVQSLIQVLLNQNEDCFIRGAAAEAIGDLGDASAIDPLIQVLNNTNEDNTIRGSAIEALGVIGHSRALEPLLVALKDSDSSIRQITAEAIGAIGNEKVVNNLLEVLNDDPDRDVQKSAKVALALIHPLHTVFDTDT